MAELYEASRPNLRPSSASTCRPLRASPGGSQAGLSLWSLPSRLVSVPSVSAKLAIGSKTCAILAAGVSKWWPRRGTQTLTCGDVSKSYARGRTQSLGAPTDLATPEAHCPGDARPRQEQWVISEDVHQSELSTLVTVDCPSSTRCSEAASKPLSIIWAHRFMSSSPT